MLINAFISRGTACPVFTDLSLWIRVYRLVFIHPRVKLKTKRFLMSGLASQTKRWRTSAGVMGSQQPVRQTQCVSPGGGDAGGDTCLPNPPASPAQQHLGKEDQSRVPLPTAHPCFFRKWSSSTEAHYSQIWVWKAKMLAAGDWQEGE